mmetsp:Transcript_1914/g.11813  ORF Transcript_1914/g.11813 Transcript_1914/m.11813 type:complete len:137 (+) Transcript_1914:2147-2557(+)
MGEADGATASHDEALAACAEEHRASRRHDRAHARAPRNALADVRNACSGAGALLPRIAAATLPRSARAVLDLLSYEAGACVDVPTQGEDVREKGRRMVEEDVDVMATQGWNDTHVARWTRWFGDAKKKKEDEDPST